MGKELNEFRNILGGVPWLTRKGLDLTKLPIDGILKQAMAEGEHDFMRALGILEAMHQRGRVEAGVFLLGLLVYSGDNWSRRTEIVERLQGFNTPECASFLFGELERIKSNNTTRRYLAAVLKVLAAMPRELVQSKLLGLIADDRFSPRMRDKFVGVLEKATRR